jgi:hypothetical protein
MIGQVEPRQLWRLKGYGDARIGQKYFPAQCYIQDHTSSQTAALPHVVVETLMERAISRWIQNSFFPECVKSITTARLSEFESGFESEIHQRYVCRADITIHFLKARRSVRGYGSLLQMRN